MHNITFDHSQESTLRAVKVDGRALITHLIQDEDKDGQQHLISCLDVFTSSLEKINLPILGNKIAETDFSFEIKDLTKVAIKINMNRRMKIFKTSKMKNSTKLPSSEFSAIAKTL